MGILDDAIREHLDLKRRRGADPTEVERAEREALGPVRRAPEAASDDEPSSDELVSDEPLSDELAEPDPPAHAPGGAYDYGSDEERDASWSYESLKDEPAAASSTDRVGASRTPDLDDDGFTEPEIDPHRLSSEPEPHSASPRPRPAGGETTEYDVEDALGSKGHEEPGDGEDVLEETPEFLQDTPDHDRLWFEQRPPKDFDFDG